MTVMAIRSSSSRPRATWTTPIPQCDLDYVPHKGYKGRIRAAISNALGFGGHNAIVLFKEYTA